MNELEDFISISKYAGERFDIVQAGGGNSSVKFDDGSMIIKASGFSLSEISENKGYVRLDTQKINRILLNPDILNIKDKRSRDELSLKLVAECIIGEKNKPSIETFLHSLLYKFTLHTHPIVVNSLAHQSNWKELLQDMFPDAMYVKYRTPGIELALELFRELADYKDKFEKIPERIFLQNHGLIVSSDSFENIFQLNESTLIKLEKLTGVDFEKHRIVNKISNLFNSAFNGGYISYLVRSSYLNKVLKENRNLFFQFSFCPDSQVFCGRRAIELNDLKDEEVILDFKDKYFHEPRIVIFNNAIYCIAMNVKKAKEMEDVLEFQIHSLENAKHAVQFLSDEEVSYLENWDAEKYRRKL